MNKFWLGHMSQYLILCRSGVEGGNKVTGFKMELAEFMKKIM